MFTKTVADIELALVNVMGIVLPLGLRGLDESNIPTSGPTGTPSRDRRYRVFEQGNRP
jgi:predicted secreted protein